MSLEVGGIRFRVDVSEASASLRKFRSEMKELGLDTGMAAKRVQELEGRFKTTMQTSQLERFKSTAGLTNLELAKLQTQAGQLGNAFNSVGRATSGFLTSLMSLRSILAGLGIALLVKDVLSFGAQFDHTMRIVAGVTQATRAELDMMTEAAMKMGASTMFNANEAALAMRYLGQAGFTASQAAQALPSVIELATASNIDLGKAADQAVHALNAMGLAVSDLAHVNDVFVATINRTSTEMADVSEAFKYGAPLAHSYGYSLEELSGLIGILGNTGIQGSMAGMQLAMSFQYVSKAAKELNLGPGADLIDVLKQINAQGLNADEIMRIFTQRSGRAVLALKQYVPELERLIEELRTSGGEAKQLADIMKNTVYGQWKQFVAVMNEVKIDVFEKYRDSMHDAIESVVGWLRDNKAAIASFVETLGTLIKEIARFLIVMGGVAVLKAFSGALITVGLNLSVMPAYFAQASLGAKLFESIMWICVAPTEAFAGAIVALSAAFKTLLPVLVIYAAWKGFSWISEAIEEHRKFEEQIQSLEDKWRELDTLPLVDLANKINTGDGFKKTKEELEDLLNKYREVDAMQSGFAGSAEARFAAGIEKRGDESAKIAERLEKTKITEFMAAINAEGITAIGTLDKFGEELNKLQKLSKTEMFRLAKQGLIVDTTQGVKNLEEFKKKGGLSLRELGLEASRLRENMVKGVEGASIAYQSLIGIIDQLRLAMILANNGVQETPKPEKDYVDELITRQQRLAEVRKAMQGQRFDTSELDKTIERLKLEIDLSEKLNSVTKQALGGTSLKVSDEESFKKIIQDQLEARDRTISKRKEESEQVKKQHDQLILDNMKNEGRYTEYVNKKYDEQLSHWRKGSKEYKWIEESKNQELIKLQEVHLNKIKRARDEQEKQSMESEGRLAEWTQKQWDKEREQYKHNSLMLKEVDATRSIELINNQKKDAETIKKIEQDKANSIKEMLSDMPQTRYSAAYYDAERRTLQTQVAEYKIILDKRKEYDKNYYQELALLAQWYQEKLKDIERQEIRDNGDFFQEMNIAWYDYYEENKKLSDKFYDYWKATYERIDQAMSDIFVEGMQGHFDTMKDAWHALLEDMRMSFLRLVYEIIKQKIILNVGTSFSGSGGMDFGSMVQQAIGGNGLNAAMNLLGGAPSGTTAISPYGGTMVPSELGGNAIAYASPYGAGAVNAAGQAIGTGAATSTTTGAGLSGALTGVGSGLLAVGSGLAHFGQGLVGGTLFDAGSALGSSTLTGAGTSVLNAGGAAGSSATSAGLSASAAMPYALAGVGGYYGGKWFSQNVLGQHGKYAGLGGAAGAMTGVAVGGSSTMMTAMGLGAFAGPIGMLAGAIIGAALGSAIGGIGPDKYAHAGTYSKSIQEILGQYKDITQAPEGVIKLYTLLEGMDKTLDQIPDWMGGRYKSELTSTIESINNIDVSTWANRYRDINGNLANAVGVLSEAFKTGLDNMDTASKKAVMNMFEMKEEIPRALKIGLDAYMQEVKQYYLEIAQEASEALRSSLGDAFQASSFTQLDVLTSAMKTRMADAVSQGIITGLEGTTEYISASQGFIDDVKTAAKDALEIVDYNYANATQQYISDEYQTFVSPTNIMGAFNKEDIYAYRNRNTPGQWEAWREHQGTIDIFNQVTDEWESNYQSAAQALDLSTVTLQEFKDYLNYSMQHPTSLGGDIFPNPNNLNYEQWIAQSMEEQGNLPEYWNTEVNTIRKFNSSEFRKQISPQIDEFKTQWEALEPLMKAAMEAQKEMNKIMMAEEYAKQIDQVKKNTNAYIQSFNVNLNELAVKQEEIRENFAIWVQQLYDLGAPIKDIVKYFDTSQMTIGTLRKALTDLGYSAEEVTLYFQDISGLIGEFSDVKFAEAIDVSSLGSDLAAALNFAAEKFAQSIADDYASGISEAFKAISRAQGWIDFKKSMKEGVYNAVSQGVVEALIASKTYANIVGPIATAIENAFNQATVEGIFDPNKFRELISGPNGPMEGLDSALEQLEALFSAAYDMMAYVGSKTINATQIVTGNTIPAYAKGGLATETSIFGEKGPEWAVPTYEPERSNFLKTVGVNTDDIGKSILQTIALEKGSTKAFADSYQMPFKEEKYLKDIGIDAKEIGKSISNMKRFASGGLANELSFVGEKGAEWVIPTYEPEKSRFLKDIGFDMHTLGNSITEQLIRNNTRNLTQDVVSNTNIERPVINSPQQIVVKIDEESIGRAFAKNIVIPESANGEVHVHVYIDSREVEDKIVSRIEDGTNQRLDRALEKRMKRIVK